MALEIETEQTDNQKTQQATPNFMTAQYGVHSAIVTDNLDPEGLGRVRVKFPWLSDETESAWARVATLMAGNERGTFFIPEINDEVLVSFISGDIHQPIIMGALWNGSDRPPVEMDTNNNKKVICSRSGNKITLDDSEMQEQVIIETSGGQKITLQDTPGRVEINDEAGNSISMNPGGITINANVSVTINGSLVSVVAGAVAVDCGMARFSGVVQCDTLISNSVISASYTPGAGNIW